MAGEEGKAVRYRIGYALAPKKQQSFIRETLISLARERGIELIKIDTGKPLIEQGPFDCVLHKLYGEEWKQELANYKYNFRHAVIVDAPESIERLHNRISMLQVVSELKAAKTVSNSESNGVADLATFGIPNQIVIYDVETLHDSRSWEALKFPVIAKPLVADGTAKSHKMSLVYNHGGLINLKPPIVLQEFVNHGGVIFKVYVAGEYVKCVKRKSLPDVAEEKLESLGGLVSFSQVSNLATNERTDEKYYKLMQLDDCEMPPQRFITDIAKRLREALKLNLFNFDVIRDTRVGNRYLVIDINYFPGYAKMPGYETVMTNFFCDLLAKMTAETKENVENVGTIDAVDSVESLLDDNVVEESVCE